MQNHISKNVINNMRISQNLSNTWEQHDEIKKGINSENSYYSV
jgi:hypothetical protein